MRIEKKGGGRGGECKQNAPSLGSLRFDFPHYLELGSGSNGVLVACDCRSVERVDDGQDEERDTRGVVQTMDPSPKGRTGGSDTTPGPYATHFQPLGLSSHPIVLDPLGQSH